MENGSLGPSEALDESKKRSKDDLVDDGTFLKDNYEPDTWQYDLGVTLDNLKRASPGATFAEGSARFMYEAIDDMARALGTGNNERDLAAVGSDFLYTSDINDFTDEQIQAAIDAYENLGSIGPSDAMMRWQKVYEEEEDPGLVSFVKAFWDNPRVGS